MAISVGSILLWKIKVNEKEKKGKEREKKR